MRYRLYLEIYLGLLSASAIAASLMSYKASTPSENRSMRLIIVSYGVSALASTLGILFNIFGSTIFDLYVTLVSVISFIAATEWLIFAASGIFSNKKKEQK